MTILRYFSVGVFSFLAVSCVNYAPRVEPAFKPGQNTVIAYGQFKFTDNISPNENSSWAYRMALQFVNEDTKKPVSIRFSKTEPLSCVRLPSSRYKLTGFVAMDSSGQTLSGKQLGPEDKIAVEFQAEPNTATYLGDFSGYAKFHDYGTLQIFETGLKEVTNNFSETTAAFHEKYPNLAALPVHSALEPAAR